MTDTIDAPAAQPLAAPAPEPDGPHFCLTAGEAYPFFERWVLATQKELVASFRIFEPSTRLRSAEARQVGETWFDLLLHALRRGVTCTIYISDFDPVAATPLHSGTWASIRELIALREVAGEGAAPLNIVPAAHPARVGLLPRIIFSPQIAKELMARVRELNRLDPRERALVLRDVPGLRQYLTVTDSGVRPRLSLPELLPATHHQKVAVFDRRRMAVGGLDLNERRWDTKDHDRPADETWHDVHVFLEDPTRAEAAARHILTLQRTTGGLMPRSEAPGLLRTLSRRYYPNLARLSPKTIVNEIGRKHRQRIAEAKGLIYLETQFFRDLQTAQRLARAGRRNPDLKLLLVLPAAPEDVAFDGRRKADARFGEFLQARCVRMVRMAFGPRVFIATPVQPRPSDSRGRDALWGAPIIYVHAKVSIFDDTAALVSSANLNGRSLYWDTELAVEFTDPAQVLRLRRRCFEHLLPKDAGEEFHDPKTALAEWRRLAVSNLQLAPRDRRGFILPYDPTPGEQFGQDLPVVPKEIV